MASAGVKFVDNLSAFKLKKVATKAADTNKKLGTGEINVALNPWADAGSLSRDKYFDPDKTTGSAQWKGLLDDNNPDVSTNSFYRDARSFIDKDEKGFSPADDAYKKWEDFAFNDFGTGNKTGELADRIDTEDVQTFYDKYYASRLVSDEDFRSSSNLRYMFEEPSAAGNTETNPNEVNVSPSKGIEV